MDITCRICGNDKHIDDTAIKYCQHCGNSLVNTCSNEQCITHISDDIFALPYEANYCGYCGAPTTLKLAEE